MGSLQLVVEEIRGKTLKLLAEACDNELLWAPPGLSNHILWHAGHALWLGDLLGIEPITGVRELPPGWSATFGQNCRPVRETTTWPARDEIRERLESQKNRLIEEVGKLSKKDLCQPPRSQKLGTERTLGYLIVHGMHDEANHQGEMRLLLKMQRTSSVSRT
jgi:hypothetical protein